MYFLTYEWLQKALTPAEPSDGAQKLLVTIFAGGMAGIANWTVGMPADVLKSRLQSGDKYFVITV